MPRRILAFGLLVAILGCRDSPTAPEFSDDAQSASVQIISPDVRRAIRDLLGDPLVNVVVETGDSAIDARLRDALVALISATRNGHARTVADALSTARAETRRDTDAAHVIGYAAIGLLLDHAATMVEGDTVSQTPIARADAEARERGER